MREKINNEQIITVTINSYCSRIPTRIRINI